MTMLCEPGAEKLQFREIIDESCFKEILHFDMAFHSIYAWLLQIFIAIIIRFFSSTLMFSPFQACSTFNLNRQKKNTTQPNLN